MSPHRRSKNALSRCLSLFPTDPVSNLGMFARVVYVMCPQATNLAAKCTAPFVPAEASADTPASATRCASDITLAEFKTLCGTMDASDPIATTVSILLCMVVAVGITV